MLWWVFVQLLTTFFSHISWANPTLWAELNCFAQERLKGKCEGATYAGDIVEWDRDGWHKHSVSGINQRTSIGWIGLFTLGSSCLHGHGLSWGDHLLVGMGERGVCGQERVVGWSLGGFLWIEFRNKEQKRWRTRREERVQFGHERRRGMWMHTYMVHAA